MPQIRDVQLKRREELARKQDALPYIRGVITDSLGNQSGAGSIWYNESERRVWYMALGANQPAQVRCVRIEPTIGLGVIIGNVPGTQDKEVLSDDPFLRQSNTTATSYLSPSARDFEPGGRLQLWLYTKVIVPLATYPISGMMVNTVAGDYPYNGARVTFPGATNTDLTASIPATPGEHRLVGLYLDSANTLQTIDGTAVAIATTPPEPTWPADAFRLCVIKLTNGDTSIDFANLTDRRMVWWDIISSSPSAWPKPDKVNIGTTEYNTIALAVAAAVSGDLIKVGEGTFAGEVTIPDGVDLIGSGLGVTIIQSAGVNPTFDFAGSSYTDGFSVANSGGPAMSADNGTVYGFNLEEFAGGIEVPTGGTFILRDCLIDAGGVTVSGGDVAIYDGTLATATVTSGTLTLQGVTVTGSLTGIVGGWWTDAPGRVYASYHRHFQMMGA